MQLFNFREYFLTFPLCGIGGWLLGAYDIYIHNLNHVRSVSEFIRSIRSGIEQGYQEFSIHWAGLSAAVFPNACVPIASVIEHYKQNGIDFYYDIDPSDYLSKCHFSEPQYYASDDIKLLASPFDQIIKYDNSSQVAAFTQRCVDSISYQTVCEDGILESLIWCIRACLKIVNTPKRRLFSRYALPIFLEIHQVFLRQIGFA